MTAISFLKTATLSSLRRQIDKLLTTENGILREVLLLSALSNPDRLADCKIFAGFHEHAVTAGKATTAA